MISAPHGRMPPVSVAEDNAVPRARVRVLVADDHPVVRLGLHALLNTQSDIEVVGLVEDGEAALEAIRRQPVDVLLLDLRMPGISGAEMLGRLQTLDAPVPTRAIIVSSFEYDEEIYTAVQRGAQGFVHKEARAEDILDAIRAVARGKRAFPKHMQERLAADDMSARLSSRQIEILQLVAKGLTNKEIARALNLSQFTVRNHLNHVMQKLDATDRTETIFIALQTGLISSP